jgi:hypothetical protein
VLELGATSSGAAATCFEPFVFGDLMPVVATAAAGRGIVRGGLLNGCDVELVIAPTTSVSACHVASSVGFSLCRSMRRRGFDGFTHRPLRRESVERDPLDLEPHAAVVHGGSVAWSTSAGIDATGLGHRYGSLDVVSHGLSIHDQVTIAIRSGY